MKRICTKCGNSFYITKQDAPLFDTLHGRCLSCTCMITDGFYPEGQTTVFSPVGQGLGDRVLFSAVKAHYVRKNPDESICFAETISQFIECTKTADKIFFSDVQPADAQSPADIVRQIMPKNATYFRLSNEATELAKRGEYPELWFDEEPVQLPDNFIALHLRKLVDQKRCPTKDINTGAAYRIFAELRGKTIVLIGNDSNADGLDVNTIKMVVGAVNVLDMRNKLTLGQIRAACWKAKLFIGKDSGLAHVAAAAGCKHLISWDFTSDKWTPKTPYRLDYFMRGDKFENVLSKIREVVNGCKTK